MAIEPKRRRGRPRKDALIGKRRASAKARTRVSNGGRVSLTAMIGEMLQRPNGVTRKEILERTGWPTVSVQNMAKANGLKLKTYKEKGQPTQYYVD